MAATRWMYVFDVTDVTSWAELRDHVANLRIPVPIVLSLVEIAEYRVTGALFLTTRLAYSGAIFLSFVLAMWPASASTVRLVLGWVLSVVFTWAIRIVHFGNPQTYDVIFPALVLAYIVLLAQAGSEPAARRGGALALGAGLALTLAELTRPYFFYLLPVLLIAACLSLWPGGRGRVVLFLLPVMLLSGSWHLYVARTHNQIVWTNHSGFNLHRNWDFVPPPLMVEEVNTAPLAPGRWLNLNTPEHNENSRRLQAAIVAYIRANPAVAATHALNRLRAFLSIPTGYYAWQPDAPGLYLYRWAAWVGLLWVSLQLLAATKALFRRNWGAFVAPETQLIGIVCLTIPLLALGDRGEEARFLITLLPMLAALPVFGYPPFRRTASAAPPVTPPATTPPDPRLAA